MIKYNKRDELLNQINNLTKRTRIFSSVRLILGLLAVFFLICFLTLEDYILYLILTCAVILVLVFTMILTNPYYHKLKILNNLNFVYKKHDNRRDNQSFSFPLDGRMYIDYNDYKVLDIDILGPKSLFQYLCCAKTKLGTEMLAKQLTNPDAKSNEFRQCVYNFANNEDTFLLEASINAFNSDDMVLDYNELIGVLDKKIKINKLAYVLLIISYILMIGTFIGFILNGINPLFSLIFLVFNFVITKKFTKNDIFKLNSIKYSNFLNSYKNISKDILNFKIDDPYFNELKMTIENEYDSLKVLCKTFDILAFRANPILHIIGNSVLAFDLIVCNIFNKSTLKIKSIEDLIAAVAEVEVIISLACVGIDNEVYCLPKEGNNLYIENGYHPLVKKCVKNSFLLGGGVILTGSNMSGKTTFQRMIGINQTLFNAGGLVCAQYFESKYLTIATSLRANDMLQEGISTFYAEINRMKKIIELAKSGKDCLILIDEIFKGTNAKDRIYSSFEIIKQLNIYKALYIITTHDFELCDAKDILNYHFNESYFDDKIVFDYLIKEGKSNTTNARYLLKMAGVIAE